VTDRVIFVTSGAQHVDLNQAVLLPDATESDAQDLVEMVLAASVPVLLASSDGVRPRVAPVLASAGFQSLAQPEALYWRPGPPPAPDGTAFEVRRVETDADVTAMQVLFDAAHGYEPDLVRGMFGERLRTDDSASGWIAWDAAEPVSFAIVTRVGGSLSLWNVLTSPRHRRRGAARAVIAAGLAAVSARAAAQGSPIRSTLFWSTPAGRPLYESMGFVVADAIAAWVFGASEADLAAVGQ
jgi:GNAT superfamily N-acetyltransferase